MAAWFPDLLDEWKRNPNAIARALQHLHPHLAPPPVCVDAASSPLRSEIPVSPPGASARRHLTLAASTEPDASDSHECNRAAPHVLDGRTGRGPKEG